MQKIPVLKPEELINLLKKLGFRQGKFKSTSHRRFIHPDGRRTTIPMHKGQDIGRGLLRQILRDIRITLEQLSDLLK